MGFVQSGAPERVATRASASVLLVLVAATTVMLFGVEPVVFSNPSLEHSATDLERVQAVERIGLERLLVDAHKNVDLATTSKQAQRQNQFAKLMKSNKKDESPIMCSVSHPCCIELKMEKRRWPQAGLGNRMAVTLQTAAIARAAGYIVRYVGEDVFQDKDFQGAECNTMHRGQGYAASLVHAAEHTNKFQNSECGRIGNGLVRTPETTAFPGYRKNMPQSEYIKLLDKHDKLDDHIITMTSKAVQGLLGLTQSRRVTDNCAAHTVETPTEISDYFHFMKNDPDDEDKSRRHSGFLPEYTGWASAGLDLLRADYIRDRASFLEESPWMAPNMQHFDPAKFNIAVHVRQGDQIQDHAATLRQLEMIMEASYNQQLGPTEGKPAALHVFTQGHAPFIQNWWNSPKLHRSYGKWVKSELTIHQDEGMTQTLDAFLTADVLGLGYSTFSAAAAMLARGAVVYMKDGWPPGDHGNVQQVPHDWFRDWMGCADKLHTSDGILCRSKRRTAKVYADVALVEKVASEIHVAPSDAEKHSAAEAAPTATTGFKSSAYASSCMSLVDHGATQDCMDQYGDTVPVSTVCPETNPAIESACPEILSTQSSGSSDSEMVTKLAITDKRAVSKHTSSCVLAVEHGRRCIDQYGVRVPVRSVCPEINPAVRSACPKEEELWPPLSIPLSSKAAVAAKKAASVPRLIKYTAKQRGFVDAAGTQFKASLWFTSEAGTLDRDDIESALATAICDATTLENHHTHGKFMPPATFNPDHSPFFQEKNFGSKIAYAPGRCVFETAIDPSKPATVTVPKYRNQKIELTLSAYPKRPLKGVAICHAALPAKNPKHPEESSGGSSTYGSWAMNNINYYSAASKPGEKPIKSYVFDAREPEVRELDPMEQVVTHLEKLNLIQMDVPFKPKREQPDRGGNGDIVVPLAQPDMLAQFALIRECADMAKYDGYKWAFFIDYDEYMVAAGGKSIEEYLEGLPKNTVSVIVDRISRLTKKANEYASTADFMAVVRKEKLIPFHAAFESTAKNWDFESGPPDHNVKSGGFPPKYFVNLANAEYDVNDRAYGRPGGIHFPYNCNGNYMYNHNKSAIPGVHVADMRTEAVIRHLKGD
jgi:hypothetical protein